MGSVSFAQGYLLRLLQRLSGRIVELLWPWWSSKEISKTCGKDVPPTSLLHQLL